MAEHITIVVTEAKDISARASRLLRSLGAVRWFDIRERSELMERLADADVLWIRLRHRIDVEVLDAAPGLKVIVSPTTGLDHIDLTAAEMRGITVLSLKGETAFLDSITATAELTWALILELARRVGAAHRDVLRGNWDRDAWVGRGLQGRTLSLLGYGRLGRIVADYGHAFRMTIMAHDPHVRDYPAHVRPASLDALLAEADVLSVHASLNATTEGLVGARAFARMKPGSWLINTARGGIVDEAALLDALRSGRIGAAALDVLAGETAAAPGWLEDSPLAAYARSRDNLLLTPHIGGATVDAMAETEAFMARKLQAHFRAAARGVATSAVPRPGGA